MRTYGQFSDGIRPPAETADAERPPDALTIVAFGVLVILAGGNAVGIKMVGYFEELSARDRQGRLRRGCRRYRRAPSMDVIGPVPGGYG